MSGGAARSSLEMSKEEEWRSDLAGKWNAGVKQARAALSSALP